MAVRLRFSRLAFFSLSLGFLVASEAPAVQVTVTWSGPSTGVWSNAANWSPAVVPVNNTPPGTTYRVEIDSGGVGFRRGGITPYDVVLDVNAAIDDLFIGGSDRLTISNLRTLTIEGTVIQNNGELALASTGNTTDLKIAGANVTLAGGGTVTMSAFTFNRILGTTGLERLTNEDNLVYGSGQLGANLLGVTNRGHVFAQAGDALTIDPSASGFVSSGILEADGGALTLGGGSYANFEGGTLGLIRANGSRVDFTGATVTGGTVEVSGSGELRLSSSSITGGVLSNDASGTIRSQSGTNTIGGNVTNPPGGQVIVENLTTLVLTSAGSTYSNAGTIRLMSTGNTTDLKISGGDVTLTGGGSVTLSASTFNRVLGNAPADRLINEDNTISGSGSLGANAMALTNRATIEAGAGHDLTVDPSANGAVNAGTMRAVGGGKLTLGGGSYANLEGPANGLIRSDASTVDLSGAAVTGGTVDVVGAGQLRMASSSITGGTVSNSGSGTIRSQSATNTIGGNVTNPLGGQVIVENLATLVFTSGSSYVNSGAIRLMSTGNTTDLKISGGDVTLTGGGSVTLSASTFNRILGNAPTDRLINQDNTISGSGSLGANAMALTNRATIEAGAGHDLTVDPSASGAVNAGTMRAVGGGKLTLGGGSYANLEGPVNGLIRSDASTVDLSGATVTGGTVDVVGAGQLRMASSSITGGTVSNSGSGTIRSQSATNTIGGNVTNPLGGQVIVENLTTLVFTSGSSYANAGSLLLMSTGNTTDLKISGGDVTLTGGGSVTLSGNTFNRILGNAPTDRLINQDNTISGSGSLGANAMALTNRATIEAAAGHDLTVDPSASGVVNAGTMRATGGGKLTLGGGSYANLEGPVNGLIRSDASTVDLSGATVTGGTVDVVAAGQLRMASSSITGGTVSNSGSGTIRSQSATNTIGGNVTNPIGGQVIVENLSTLVLQGPGSSYSNAGTIALQSSGNTTDLRISGDVTLTGGGDVTLSANAFNRILGTAGTDRLTNQDNTISGSGSLGANFMILSNLGEIHANQPVPLTIDVTAGAGAFTSSGVVRVSTGSTLNLSDTLTQTGGTTTVDGTLSGGSVSLMGGTLNGEGTVTGPVTSPGGTIAPGKSPGILGVGSLALSTTAASLDVELNGAAPGSGYDQLNVTGTVGLGGATLDVLTGFAPSPGTVFTILLNDGTDAITGTFNGLPQGTSFTAGGTQYTISYTGGSGNDVVLTVQGGGGNASTTSLGTAPNPSVFGQAVMLTATVSGGAGTPTGTVTFKEGAAVLGTAALTSGQATLPVSGLSVGAHAITAEYGGDATYLASASSPVTQTVNKAAAGTSLVSDANPSGAGQTVTFTATVSAVSPGAGTPTGTVTFKDGGSPLTSVVLSGGQATFPTAGLSVGSHTITAEYSGDSSFTASTSNQLVQVVTAGTLDHFLVEAAGGGNIPPQVAGTPFNVRITARDALGNVVTDFGANVLITSNGALSGAPVSSGTFVAGVLASQSVTITSAQNGVTLTATEPESTASGTSNAFNVSPAGAVSFLIEAGAGGAIPPQTAGVAFSIRITARDQHGATVTSFTGTVSLTTSAGAISPTSIVFQSADNGVRTFNVTLDTAGTSRTIAASEPGGGTGTSNAFTVNAGGVASFLVEAAAGGSIPPQMAGTAFGLRITARDGFGNVATGFTGSVNLTTNAGPISPTTVTFQSADNGVRTINVTLTLSGTARTITVTDGGSGGTGTSNTFTVNPGILAGFLVESAAGGAIPGQTEGVAFGIRVTARDAFGNVATGFVGTANLTVNAGSIAPASTPFVAGDGGVKTLSVTLSPAGSGRAITATDPVSGSAGTSNAFDVTSVVALAPDLSIFKSHAGSFRVGSQGVYTIRVTNAAGGGPTTGLITVVDDLPAGLPFVSASGGGFTCTPSALRVTCTRAAPLAPGVSALISLTVGATSVAVPQVVNTVAVATAGDLNTGNDVATDPTDVLPAVDFNLVLDPTELTVLAGGEDGNLTVSIAAATGVYNVAFASLPDINVFPPSFLLSGGASRSVLVSAESPAAAGTFSLLVTATEITTSRVKTAFLRLTVTRPTPDFTLAVSPASTSLRPGGDPASLTITATPSNGFTGTVSVTAPALADLTFTPSSFDLNLPGGPVSRTISVAAGLNAAPGTTATVFTGTGGGLTRTAPLDVAVEALPPVIDTFTASPTSIASGQTSTLSWTSRFATSARIDPGVGSVPASGSTVVSPSATITYTLTVTGPGGSATAQASVRVCVAPSAPGAPTITSLGSPQAPVTGVDELLLAWLAPASGEPPSRYEYRVNGEPYTSTAQTSAEAAPRGDANPIQLFVRAYACSPERGPSAEAASPVYSRAPPVADFTAPATASVNQSITLTDTSFPQATSWLWLYDDGTPPGTTQTQNHIFRTAGAHDVILVAINGSGTSIKTRTINVTATASAPAPALTLRAFEEPEGERRRLGRVSLAPARSTRLLVAADAAGSGDDVPVFLRFLDSRGQLVRERRLAVPPGPESAFDLSGMAPQGVYTLELVAGVPLRAWVEEPTLSVREAEGGAPRRRDLPAPINP